MKYRVEELEGPLLDKAVALALGKKHAVVSHGRCWAGINHQDQDGGFFYPGSKWEDGGPILEQLIAGGFGLHPSYFKDQVGVFICGNFDGDGVPFSGNWTQESIDHGGPTVLVAVMRTFVEWKLGAEIEI